jgi:hypothetical protein
VPAPNLRLLAAGRCPGWSARLPHPLGTSGDRGSLPDTAGHAAAPDASPLTRARRQAREQCSGTLKDGSRCEHVAADGDLCRPCAKRVAAADERQRAVDVGPIAEEELADEPSVVIRRVADLRTALAEDTNAAYGKLWGVLEAALDASKNMKAPCDHCGKWTRVPVPDMNARVKAAQLLIEYTAGRPATTPAKPAAPVGRPIAEWTEAELLAAVQAPEERLPNLPA